MAIDPHFIPAFSIEDVLLDKDTGAPLSGGLVYFEQDNNRGVLKPIYQITGTSPDYSYTQLPNPMELSSIGTFEDALSNPVIPYFYPFDALGNPEYYYVRVTSSAGEPQFVREAVPYIPQELNPSESAVSFTNELSNPQFAEVSFDTSVASYTYNFSAATLETIEIAPNWNIVVSGTGTVTVSQSRPIGSLNRPTNAGTLLNINSSGVSYLRLQQRLYGSPNLFGSGYLSGYFIAKTFGASSSVIRMYYSQSNGTVTNQEIVNKTLPATGAYTVCSGNAEIPVSTSAEDFPDAYVSIEIDIPLSTNIEITSIQAVSTGANSIAEVPYDEQSNNRQIDYLFHYYQPQLNYKPIPSLLTAWDFPLNPAQALGHSLNITTTAAYIWDQTISNSVVGNVAVVQSSITSGLQATTANNNEAFYLMQYLDGAQAKEILGTTLSANISAFRTQAGGEVTVKVYLYSGRSAASFPTLPTSLGTVAADGTFTLTAANWTLIPRSNLGQASGTLSTVNTGDYSQLNDVEDLQFNGWELTDAAQIADTNKFAIVVTFSCPTTGTVVTVDSISLVKGDIPTRPAAQTFDQVLEECQYYYEKNYDNSVIPGTSAAGGLVAQQVTNPMTGTVTVGTVSLIARAFGFNYNTVKRSTTPTVTLYSPNTGTSARVYGVIFNNGASIQAQDVVTTVWTQTYRNSKGCSFIPNTAGAVFTSGSVTRNESEAYIVFHYTVDARLGIV